MKPGRWICIIIAVIFTALGAFVVWDSEFVCAQNREYADFMKEIEAPDSEQEFPVPLRPLSKTITPCRACHGPERDFPVNFRRKEDLLVHANIRLNHGGIRLWCLDCHHPDNRNYLLPLSDGQDIPFERSFLLCGKCHGTIYRDWKHGIHGKRTGSWNGPKNYYLCVSCHDPHNPRFKPLSPMPPPKKPWTPTEVQVLR
ncbi:MAG: hypothetical protein QG577_1515 [Thermodesulfobacteriota bacterium]|nr:hypothetical protein [Thermodesulfobacteriota bacterium]